MVASGYNVTPADLTTLASRLHDHAGVVQQTLATYDVSIPDFGQANPAFSQGHVLAGTYASRLAEQTQAVTDYLTAIRTMGDVAMLLGKRYQSLEEMNAARADDIKRAVSQVMSQAPGPASPPPVA